MPELEILELIAMFLIIIPFSFAYFILKRRKDMYPLLPGATFLVLSFICTNLEALAAPDTFNFLEHFFIMLCGISFLLGIIYMHFISEKSIFKSNVKEKEGM
jgi:predicted tellurium resistance membrane protein TerC